MEIMSLGHAGLRVSGTNAFGLVDPWFDPSGAYLGSWFPLPDNRHLVTPELFRPDWLVITGDGGDRCDPATLAHISPETPTFVPTGHRRMADRLRREKLRVVEVPPTVPVRLEHDGSRLTFVPSDDPLASARSIVLSVDRMSLLVCAPTPPNGAHLQDIRSTMDDHFDVVAVQVARPTRALLCEDESRSRLRRRSTAARARALEEACATVRAARASAVLPFGGPPCFLDPELDALNQWIASPGFLPDVEQVGELLRARLPSRRVVSLLPGDRYFPADDLVVDDPRWRGFSFLQLRHHVHGYAHARAVELSRLHSRFPDPDESVGHGFAAHLAALTLPHPAVHDHVRFEVTGGGGGDWDVVVDERGVTLDLSGRISSPTSRIRIASRWIAAVIDGRVSWPELLRSFRYSVAHVDDRHDDPLLDLLEQVDRIQDDARTSTRSPTDR